MKVVLPKTNSNKFRYPMPIALDRAEKKSLSKSEYISLKLRTNPTDADSQTYNIAVPYHSSGSLEKWLKFLHDIG